MSVTSAVRPRGVDVVVTGPFSPREADRMVEAVRDGVAEAPGSILVDLSQVTRLTAAATAALFALADLARDWPEWPIVVVANESLHAQMEAVDLTRRLVVRSTLLAARAAAGTAPVIVVDQLDLLSSLEAPGVARHFLLRHLPANASRQLRDNAALVVTELVSNAVLHGGGRMRLRLVRRGRQVRIAVTDSVPVRELPAGDSGLGAEHGRGLMMVRALSVRFGTLPTASGGKVVWSLLDDAGPVAAAAR